MEQTEGAVREYVDSDYSASMAYDAFASVNEQLGFKLLPEAKPRGGVKPNNIGKIGSDAALEKLKELYPNAIILEQVEGTFDDGTKTKFDFIVVDKSNGVIAAAESKASEKAKVNVAGSDAQRMFYGNGDDVTITGGTGAEEILGQRFNKDQVETHKLKTSNVGKPE